MKWRVKAYCDIGPMLCYWASVDKNGVEVMDGNGKWVDTPKYISDDK